MSSRRSFLALAGFALAAVLVSPPSQAKSNKLKHVLVVTHTEGFRHSSIPTAEGVIQQLGEKNDLWETDYARNADDVRQKITGDYLKNVDLVIFASTTGELPITDDGKKAFLDWLRDGHGFVGMHAATDTLYQWADYGKMIGAYFDGHPWHQKVSIHVDDPKFPGVKGFLTSPEVDDEIYQFRNWSRDDKHVILSIENSSIDVSLGKRADQDYAVAWARMEGKGRVFYTSLGHEDAVWNDPRYQEHILAGIKWALGLTKANVKPGNGRDGDSKKTK